MLDAKKEKSSSLQVNVYGDRNLKLETLLDDDTQEEVNIGICASVRCGLSFFFIFNQVGVTRCVDHSHCPVNKGTQK